MPPTKINKTNSWWAQGRGSAIAVVGGATLVVEDSSFANCKTNVYGGAVYAHGVDLTVRNTTFRGCAAAIAGGAMPSVGADAAADDALAADPGAGADLR